MMWSLDVKLVRTRKPIRLGIVAPTAIVLGKKPTHSNDLPPRWDAQLLQKLDLRA